MAGLNIGKNPFLQNQFPKDNLLPTNTSDPKAPPLQQPRMAKEDKTACRDDSDCTHKAQCFNFHCFCFEEGIFCDAKPKPLPKATPIPTARPVPTPTTSPRPRPQAKPKPPGSLCGSGCSVDASCDPQKGCVCHNTLKLEVNGTCSEDPKATNGNGQKGVIRHHQIHKILNSTHPKEQDNIVHTSAGGDLSTVLYIVLPLGLLLVLGFVITVVCLRRRRQHRLGPKRNSESVVKSGDGIMLLDRMNNINKNPTYFISPGDDPSERNFLVKEICMDHVVLVDVVGEGAFGQVYRGELHVPETNSSQLVAVKVLKENVSNEIREDFEREVEIMSAFDHDNILKLVGVVTQNAGQSPYMIFEYMVHGDLAELLRKSDPAQLKHDRGDVRLQKTDLVDIATQIANGMRYLTSQHFVHRDLATRNCLVGDGLVVKISDFGMSRDIYTCDYYKIGGSRMLPVRWMSPESVKYGKFTSESDAWAYGVVLWEIFCWGRQPYYGHSNEEVVRFLDAGILLQRPEDCPSTIYHIMLGCWKADPKERLSFEKIYKHLDDYHQRLVKMAASQSPQLAAPAAASEADPLQQQQQQMQQPEVKPVPAPSSPDPSDPSLSPSISPHLSPLKEALVSASGVESPPRQKPALKATMSDPETGAGLKGLGLDGSEASSHQLTEASRTSSQTLMPQQQRRVQQPEADQRQPQELGDSCQDVVLKVKLPPASQPQSHPSSFSSSSSAHSSDVDPLLLPCLQREHEDADETKPENNESTESEFSLPLLQSSTASTKPENESSESEFSLPLLQSSSASTKPENESSESEISLPLLKSSSGSVSKLHATDSGFSSGEQHWVGLESSDDAASPGQEPPPSAHGDVILEPLTSVVCTSVAEVV